MEFFVSAILKHVFSAGVGRKDSFLDKNGEYAYDENNSWNRSTDNE